LDDGTRGKSSSGNCSIQISTHGFPKEEVELLAAMLTSRGVEAKAAPVHKGLKVYWVILIGVEATRIFRDKIRSFVPSCMSYKLEIPDAAASICACCGATYTPEHPNAKCGKRSCRELRRKEVVRKFTVVHRKERNQERREAYYVDLEKSRAYGRILRQNWLSDPAIRSQVNEYRRKWRQKRALLRERQTKPCQFCQKPVELKNSQFLSGATICCLDPECRRKKRAETNRRYLERHADAVAERNRNWNQSERGKSYKQQWTKENSSAPTSSPSNTLA
jgi:uncharacterized OB-fold protein